MSEMGNGETKKIYGIDLGTTYSCIAHINKNGEAEIVPNAEGDLTTPSVVYFESDENIVVGKAAKQAAIMYDERVADFVKRSMGDQTYEFEVDGKNYRPEEISALILKKLVQDASQYLGEEITDVVITCPAYFGIAEREATKIAGEIAGLKRVHQVINEPTAAAFAYGLDRAEEDKVVLVYDLGGGTFDVTMIEIKKGEEGGKNVTVISTGGDHQLGGKDWDDRIIQFFASEFMKEYGDEQDPRDDRYTMQDLRDKAEEAKKALSSRENYKTIVSYEGNRKEIELTREKFEELTADLLDRTLDLTKKMMEEAEKKGYSEVDEILLLGGASKMPMVANKVKSMFEVDPFLYEPDHAVAKGAALAGSVSVEDTIGLPPTTIINVNSKALGVVVVRIEGGSEVEYVYHVIDKHTPLPVKKTETSFGTVRDNQTEVKIELREQADGNSDLSESLEHNKHLADDIIKGLPSNLPAGSPIHITFKLQDDGMLTVHAMEPSSGEDVIVETKVDGIMSEEDAAKSKEALGRIQVQ